MANEITQVGRILGNAPRAVQIREPENQDVHHSAIHGAVNIMVDSQKQRSAILSNWTRIVEAISEEVEQILSEIPVEGG